MISLLPTIIPRRAGIVANTYITTRLKKGISVARKKKLRGPARHSTQYPLLVKASAKESRPRCTQSAIYFIRIFSSNWRPGCHKRRCLAGHQYKYTPRHSNIGSRLPSGSIQTPALFGAVLPVAPTAAERLPLLLLLPYPSKVATVK